MPCLLFTLALIASGGGLTAPAAAPARASSRKAEDVRISLKIGDTTLTAKLIDGPTSRDFASLLPLTLTMDDLFRREKYGRLPRALSGEGKRTHGYAIGDVVYWSPGPDVAIIYRHGGPSIPDPGIIVVAKVDSGVQVLDVPGSTRVTFELIE